MIRRTITKLATAGAILCACDTDEPAARAATIQYDTVGDTIVARYDGAPAWGDAVTLQEELRIGALEGADEYTLGNIVGLTVDSAHNIYALDQQVHKVRKYDAHGRHLLDIGRKGAGPGEFDSPNSLGFLPDGRLAVRDYGNGRITLFDATGAAAGTITIPLGFYTSTPMHIDTLGRVYSTVMADRLPNGMFRTGFQRFDATGNVQDTVRNPHPDFNVAQPLVARAPDGGGMSAQSVPFMPGVQWTIDRGGNIVWGAGDDYTIHTMRAGRAYHIKRTIAPVAVQAAEKSSERDRIELNMKRTQPNWSWQGPAIPDTKPFFNTITVADDGRIWVRLSQPAVREPADTTVTREPGAPPPADRWIEPQVYDIFEPDGRLLAQVRLPARFTPRYMRGDHIWGVQRDELDVNYVVRLRLVH